MRARERTLALPRPWRLCYGSDMTSAPRAARSAVFAAAAIPLLLVAMGLTGCSSLSFERTTETSGTLAGKIVIHP